MKWSWRFCPSYGLKSASIALKTRSRETSNTDLLCTYTGGQPVFKHCSHCKPRFFFMKRRALIVTFHFAVALLLTVVEWTAIIWSKKKKAIMDRLIYSTWFSLIVETYNPIWSEISDLWITLARILGCISVPWFCSATSDMCYVVVYNFQIIRNAVLFFKRYAKIQYYLLGCDAEYSDRNIFMPRFLIFLCEY
jgi:hypothetical protein